MRTIEMSSEDVLAAADAIPEDAPVFMLNLLCYREHADYGDRANAAPCSGREAYFQRYLPAFNKIASSEKIEGIKVFYVGNVLARLVAPPDEQWDDIAIVEYPNFAAFRRVVESPEYKAEATPHRKAALEDSRLIAMTKMELPG
ncbi:MAG: hypothetical protein M3388_11830 [Acidobacteriota bacterium]|nr:hypothetical protein [Acidobacteriota bacterium]